MIPQSRISQQISKIKAQQQQQQEKIIQEQDKLQIKKIKKVRFSPCSLDQAQARWKNWLKQQNFTAFDFQLKSDMDAQT